MYFKYVFHAYLKTLNLQYLSKLFKHNYNIQRVTYFYTRGAFGGWFVQ